MKSESEHIQHAQPKNGCSSGIICLSNKLHEMSQRLPENDSLNIEYVVKGLREELRYVYVLSEYHKFSDEDIAEICDFKVEDVRVYLNEARENIHALTGGKSSDWKVQSPQLTDDELKRIIDGQLNTPIT